MSYGKRHPWIFAACSSLHCICMRMSMTCRALSAYRKPSLAAPLVKQHRKSRKRKESEEEGEKVPTWVWHSAAGLICSPWQPCRVEAEGRGTPGFPGQYNTERHGCLNPGDIPVVSGSNAWISMNWLRAPCSGPQNCPVHIRSSRCPLWPLLTCFQPLAAFTLTPQG